MLYKYVLWSNVGRISLVLGVVSTDFDGIGEWYYDTRGRPEDVLQRETWRLK